MNFFKYTEVYPFLEVLKKHRVQIANEIEGIQDTDWVDWPEKYLYANQEWKIIPFTGFGVVVKESRQMCPFTFDLVMSLPEIQTALISRVPAGMSIASHQGWGELANHVLRCHLVLQTNNKCSLTVGGETRKVRPGHIIVFDDSKIHSACNGGETDKIVLILDFPRPPGIPDGISEIEKSPELMAILQNPLGT
jgi:aspartyl/asparaginyl beta-hydroxylase (cupin superfamily)